MSIQGWASQLALPLGSQLCISFLSTALNDISLIGRNQPWWEYCRGNWQILQISTHSPRTSCKCLSAHHCYVANSLVNSWSSPYLTSGCDGAVDHSFWKHCLHSVSRKTYFSIFFAHSFSLLWSLNKEWELGFQSWTSSLPFPSYAHSLVVSFSFMSLNSIYMLRALKDLLPVWTSLWLLGTLGFSMMLGWHFKEWSTNKKYEKVKNMTLNWPWKDTCLQYKRV